MGTNKLSRTSKPEMSPSRIITGSLPLKKRKIRLNPMGCAHDSHCMTRDSSVKDEKADVSTSLCTPKTALSVALPQEALILTSRPAADPSSPNPLGSFPENPRIGRTITKNLPRLVTPLPNGCHWQTIRHKSYCRRMPCYKNSNFCKLHYQQYLNISKSRHPDGDGTSQTEKNTSVIEGAPLLPDILQHHQDRRYTEASGQVRCLATTTRGRPCAYVAVNDTKYCYLHSQYEKSRPTPRRSSYTTTIGISPRSSSQSRLCSLPTDSWLNQPVIISIGPLRNSTGTVEKWGNGWVSVRVPGVGLHNRRSFELLVISGNGRKQDDGSIPSASQVRQVTDSSSSDEASLTSSNRSISKSPVPTLILADKGAPQHIVSPHAV